MKLNIEPYEKDLSVVATYLDDYNFTKVKTKYTKGDDWTAISFHGYGKNAEDILKPNVLKSKVKMDTKLQSTDIAKASVMKPILKILDSLPCEFERVRFMKLKSGSIIGKHTDKIDKDIANKKIVRLHIPIRTNDDVVVKIYKDAKDKTGKQLNLKTGHYYYLDVSKPHSVSNNSDVDRYHLVVDCFVNDKIRTLLGWTDTSHSLTDKDITILEHIVFVAEKSAKTVQFCFKKGKQQSYITPKKELLITFELSTSIEFDYPVADLKTFLAEARNVMDPYHNSCDVNSLVLPSSQDLEDFQTKKVQEIDFTFDDLRTNQRLKKFKHLNVMGANNKCIFRYQNHERSWWFDDGNKEEFPRGRCSRKFRYVINRERLRLLPNDYKLILREDVMQFQLKHLNYYFIPEISWQRHSVKDWTDASSIVTDEHLIAQYIKKGFLNDSSSLGCKHAILKDLENIKEIFKPYKKDYFPHVRNDYLTRMIKSGNVILDKDVVITYNHYKRKQTITEGVIAEKGDCVLHQIVSKNHDGSATDVLQRFFKQVNVRVFLTVRSSNATAKKFYKRNGMKIVGQTSWANSTIAGDVYLKDNS